MTSGPAPTGSGHEDWGPQSEGRGPNGSEDPDPTKSIPTTLPPATIQPHVTRPTRPRQASSVLFAGTGRTRTQIASPPIKSVAPEPIYLEDRTFGKSPLWACEVAIVGYTVVGASDNGAPNPGAYVVWHIRTKATASKAMVDSRRRYSEFVKLRAALKTQYPECGREIPKLPPRAMVARTEPKFLEERRQGLEYFLLCVVLNPKFTTSLVLKQFISGH